MLRAVNEGTPGRGGSGSPVPPDLSADPASQGGGHPLLHPRRDPGEATQGGGHSTDSGVKGLGVSFAMWQLSEQGHQFNLPQAQFI